MVLLHIQGVKIHFPFTPYSSQKAYMKTIIQSLNQSFLNKFTTETKSEPCKFNALLESPTGTGKTMCLLCACLAWRIHFVERTGGKVTPPRIYFASRTHSQLTHAIKELKKSPYTARIAIMSSRNQLCVHEDLQELKGPELNQACRQKRNNCSCDYFSNFVLGRDEDPQKMMKDMNPPGEEIQDIEDLFKKGREKKYCPFYYQRYMQEENAELVFLPYNYLMSSSMRELTKIDLKNSIVIFDEAHNLPQVSEDSMTIELSMNAIIQSILELDQVSGFMRSVLPETTTGRDTSAQQDLRNVEELMNSLLSVDMKIDSVDLPPVHRSAVKSGQWIFDLFSEAGITHTTFSYTSNVLLKSAQFLRDQRKASFALEKLNNTLKLLFGPSESADVIQESFRVNLQEYDNAKFLKQPHYEPYLEMRKEHSKPKNEDTIRKLELWCLNPALAIQNLVAPSNRPPQTLLLTSGTLSPMKSYAQELGIPFPPVLRLENPHVIKRDQLSIFVCPTAKNGRVLSSDFSHRSSTVYHEGVGESLVEISKVVPGGLLVFFASYNVMNLCITTWKETSIYSRIENSKSVFLEPPTTKELPNLIESYRKAVRENEKGAIMFAVCRGKVAEGLDFANENGRCVVVVGMPFPPREDPRVLMKQEVLDRLAQKDPEHHTLRGRDWYAQQCSQAINQSVGRVIRHRNDYGAVILMDDRFSQRQQQAQLSLWLQKHVKVTSKFGDLMSGLKNFYTRVKTLPLSNSASKNTTGSNGPSTKKISISDARVIPTKQQNVIPKLSKKREQEPYKAPSNASHLREQSQSTESKRRGQNFVREAKLNLSGRDFATLKSIIKSFPKRTPEEKVEAVRQLKDLLSTHPDLIEGLKPFVGEYAEHLQSRKRKAQDLLTGQARKHRRTGQQTATTRAPNSISPSNTPSSFSISESSKTGSKLPSTTTTTTSTNPWVRALSGITSQSSNTVEEISGSPSVQDSSNTNTDTASASNPWKCPVCLESSTVSNPKHFSAAPCGHICCNTCWDNLLKFKVECPVCKTKVRQKNLVRLYPQ